MKVGRTLEEMKEMITSSLDKDNKAYILKIDSHAEARLLLESVKSFEKLNVSKAPDSKKLKSAIKEIEEKFNYKTEGMNKVINISFKGVEGEENKNRIIYFKPDKFTPEEYCNLFFYEEGEENQYEELLGIILENNFFNYQEGVRFLSNNFS